MFLGARTKKEFGSQQEKRAEAFLLGLGYRLIARNVSYPFGEIDLIFEETRSNHEILVFVEVRMRDSRSYATPEESLMGGKSRRLLKAVGAYLQSYRGKAEEVRIDLIAITESTLMHYSDFISK